MTGTRRPTEREQAGQKLSEPWDALCVWDPADAAALDAGRPRYRVAVDNGWGRVTAVALRADGGHLYVGHSAAPVCRIEALDLTPDGPRRAWVRALDGPAEAVVDLAASPDGRWLAVVANGVGSGHNVHARRATDGAELDGVTAFPGRDSPCAGAIAPTGRALVAASQSGVVTVWPIEVE